MTLKFLLALKFSASLLCESVLGQFSSQARLGMMRSKTHPSLPKGKGQEVFPVTWGDSGAQMGTAGAASLVHQNPLGSIQELQMPRPHLDPLKLTLRRAWPSV